MSADVYIMRCLELAQRGKGLTGSNPMVGAVLVHNHTIISEGWHKGYGLAHAEVDCLNNLPTHLQHLLPESTMYVSLEPCAHQGKTPPCAPRLVQERIKEVVICNRDPFPLVDGKGMEILTNAGIKVTTGILENEGRWVNRRFFCFHEQKRPYIILKWAATSDGYIGSGNAHRLLITNSLSNTLVHKWRTEEAAIMIGSTTALKDAPQLNARHWQGRNPLRVILGDAAATTPPASLLGNDAPTWFMNSHTEQEEGNIAFKKLSTGANPIAETLALLHRHGINSVLVEGGRTILQSFIALGLWDEARVLGSNTMAGEGVPQPILTHAQKEWEVTVGSDRLTLFTRMDTAYPYPGNMPL